MKDAPEETPEYHDTLEKFLRFMAELPSVRRVAAWKWIHHMTAQRYPADLVGNMKDPEPEKGMVTLPVEKIPFPSAA